MQRTGEVNVQNLLGLQPQGQAAHDHAHIHAAHADSQHSQSAAGGAVAVRTHKEHSRGGNPLGIDAVAHAVARHGVAQAEGSGTAADKGLIVGGRGICGYQIVVSEDHRLCHGGAFQPDGITADEGEDAGHIVKEDAVNPIVR